jgi:hypothetical protein
LKSLFDSGKADDLEWQGVRPVRDPVAQRGNALTTNSLEHCDREIAQAGEVLLGET